LVLTPGAVPWESAWVWLKLGALLALQLVHAGMARWRRHFAADANRHGEGFYRVVNEVPTLLMIIIVIMVVVKPF
jgi:putative membrane protein